MRYHLLTATHKVKAQFETAQDLNAFYDSLPPEERFFYAVVDTKEGRVIPGFVYMNLSDEERFQ